MNNDVLTSKMCFHPEPDVVYTKLNENEGALLHLKTKMYFTTNDSGTMIWELMQSGHSIDEIAEQIQATFNVDQPVDEVCTFLEFLKEENLIRQQDV